jgi:hypothetical protein
MLSLKASIKATFVTFSAVIMTLGLPVASLASASADECAPPPASQPGVHWPTGSDSGTFTYQCDGAYAGKWTNTYYLYDPSTSSRSPLYSPEYSFDCSSGKWTMTQWDYSAADGQYHKDRVTTSDPGLPTNCPVPDPPAASDGSGGSGSGTTAANSLAASNPSGSNGGNNSINNALNNTYNANNNTTGSMNNVITSVGTSGSAAVLGNTTAGGATSGDVMGIANIVNMLQSTSNSLGTADNLVVFTANIDGDVNGDLMLDPSMLSQVQPASTNTVNNDLNNNVTINNSSDASINNKIDLAAASGDATVASNTSGGDATSGNAKAVANIINVINSAITSGKSFIGVININGNLNGDILLPPDFVDQLLAANVPTVTISGPASNNSSNTTVNDTTNITNTNNQGITNNIHATADTGNASVSGNTSAGSATSGSGNTNITAFNLTGSNVIGTNDLLVFVNVLGKWVGLIVNAPAGTTAASLGGSVTQNTTVNNDTAVNNNVNQKINNDINVASKSGDATVSRNTKAGNAKSGNADSAVNLMNMENSTISLSGWLGILFINVFGTWNGSFGMNTSAGDPITNAVAAAQQGGSDTPQVFRFVPSGGGGTGSGYDVAPYSGTNSGSGSSDTDNTDISSAQRASALLANAHIQGNNAPIPQTQGQQNGFGMTSALIGGSVVLFILGDAWYTRRHPERA